MTLYELVKRRIDGLVGPWTAALASGSCKDYAEYHRLVGKIEGASKAFADIEGLLGEDLDPDEPGL